MPLEIIRNDITRVSADAIVNTANPEVAVGAGVDSAIYAAAGWDELLAERAAIGPMEPGDAAVTPAFALHAKHIIHTIGPVWEGGMNGEIETVARCYRNSLNLAKELECESVAFPLIATGTYGFPKDLALTTAVSEISRFLFDNEMTVYMVVYDKEAFTLSEKVYSDVESFIEEKDIISRMEREAKLRESAVQYANRRPGQMPPEAARKAGGGIPSFHLPEGNLKQEALREERAERSRVRDRFRKLFQRKTEESLTGSAPPGPAPRESIGHARDDAPSYAQAPVPEPFSEHEASMISMDDTMEFSMDEAADYSMLPSMAPESLDDILRHREDTFQEYLFRVIDRKGMDDVEVYKRANLDRKHFSKIKSNIYYNPSKKTALALAVALGLNLDETRDLLGKAGIALTRSNTFDIIMEYCISHGIHDIYEINCILFNYDQPTLGA